MPKPKRQPTWSWEHPRVILAHPATDAAQARAMSEAGVRWLDGRVVPLVSQLTLPGAT